MGNEKYLNYYIETLTSTMTDCVIRNVSMQANAKVTDDVVKEQNALIEKLTNENNELATTVFELKTQYAANENETIKSLTQDILKKDSIINELNAKKDLYESGISQVNHVDTFRKELVKARKQIEDNRIEYENQIEELNKRIEYLQLTPAKRKKIDELNKVVDIPVPPDTEIKDGGSF